jgi:hypothetical protein
MSTISAIQASVTKLTQSTSQLSQSVNSSTFESLLSSFGTSTKPNPNSSFMEFSSSLLDLIVGFQSPDSTAAVDFPFSSNFTSTFGTSGPLPTFIAATVANLKLSPSQQLALQDIAVQNKDITKTTANVQKVAIELQAAGIGVA